MFRILYSPHLLTPVPIASLICLLAASTLHAASKPNVVLVITDDQGYGDVGAHGNKMIKTPNLDRLYSQCVRLTDFHVDPTCAPTRSALISGRYSTRTGVWHTIMGRSLMSTDELSVAEVFRSAGYRTGMYGKWHLGDNAPCRPQDQGFDETFYHGGGGVTQTPDYFGNDYFDDTYFRNGVPEEASGYCTDVWFDNALNFIEKNARAKQPFFAYLSTNAPHGPFLVADKYSQPYKDQGVPGSMAPFYGMITNIDENMGRLMARLDELGIAQDTILIFMTDNGTAAGVARGGKSGKTAKGVDGKPWHGFNDGMRGQKGSEYDGGHRVPFFIRWPGGGLQGGRDVDVLSAHIDVLPTLAELCGINKPEGPPLDGISLATILRGAEEESFPHDRIVIVHSQRIEHPQKWRKSSVMTKGWRLVNGKELYEMKSDPGQTNNIADIHPEVANKLTAAYDAWWQSLTPVLDDYVRIHLGGAAENPAHLTCHDWHTEGGAVPWNQGHIRSGAVGNGFWAVDVQREGKYEVTLRRWPKQVGKPIEANAARLKIGDLVAESKFAASDPAVTFTVDLPRGPAQMQTWLTMENGKQRGAYFVEAKFLPQR